MSTSHRRKEKNEKSRRLSTHNDDEGSAARTRPFSFEQVMQRRKRKNLSEDVKEGVVEAKIMSSEGAVKNVTHGFESERDYKHRKGSSPVAERYVAEDERKLSSKKQEKKTSVTNKSEEGHVKAKDRGTLVLKSKVEVGSFRLENDMKSEIKGGENDKQIRDRRDNDKRTTNNTQKEDGKRHSRDSRGKERHGEVSRGKYERESKRKYQNGDDLKNKDRKKLDTGRHYETDNSVRNKRKESSQSHFEEPKLRRERSRSRDLDDRRRRSRSPSRKDHKRASYIRTTPREVASHSLKDKSQKQHYADRSRLSTNGSSSHHSRRGESTSGLGGYSPRKRITEAAAKTPPPPDHLSEKKSAKWDLPPVGSGNMLSGSVPNIFSLSSNNTGSASVQKLASAAPVTSTIQLPSGVSSTVLSTRNFPSIDSIQLTQATRPMRRLYVENMPSSTSEKALVEWFNDLLLSLNANHIQGTQPCISCIINKEKGQALVEFLTPEDASAALSFDGNSISGFILKIRRPKDFVEVATGDVDKSMDAVGTISDVVKDSLNKIFIGGISKTLSSKMLMEIVSAFGPLKAYHFVVDDKLNEPCAFLEYVDPSLTPKACAGLNGMKLGGKVLTAVQAIRTAESLENKGNSSLYKIPEHAKPLLKQPMQVLKLKNVFNVEGFYSLSEAEVEEVVEDIRLECSRFGNVKSVNVVRQGNSETTSTGICEPNTSAKTADFGSNLGREEDNAKNANLGGHTNDKSSGIDAVEFVSDEQELKEDEVLKDNCTDNKQRDDIIEDKSCQAGQLNGDENAPNCIPEGPLSLLNSPKEVSEHLNDEVASTTPTNAHGTKNKLKVEDNSTLGDTDGRKKATVKEYGGSKETESNVMEKDGSKEESFDLGSIFEVGCVFVEFRRTEAACTAAHCLHGRVFDDRIVSVEYVAFDHYKTRFLT